MCDEERQLDQESESLVSSCAAHEANSFSLEPRTLAAAIVGPYCFGRNRNSSFLEPDKSSCDALVYAVRDGAVLAPVYSSRRSRGGRNCDRWCVEEDVSDTMLLKNVADGDKAAMHIIFARHRAKVLRFIRRVVSNSMLVSDLVGQVFLDAWCSASRSERCARVSGWVSLIDWFNETSDAQELTFRGASEGDTRDAIGKTFDSKEADGVWLASVEKLSSAHAEIIQLFYYRGKSVAEIGEILSLAPARAKSRMFYARKHLARNLVSASSVSQWRRKNTKGEDEKRPASRLTCGRRRAKRIQHSAI
jgi:RNA polymerase sigma factor (sigma-70 family)